MKEAKVYHHLYKEIYVYFFSFYSDSGFYTVRPVRLEWSVKASFTDQRNSPTLIYSTDSVDCWQIKIIDPVSIKSISKSTSPANK